MPDLIGLNCHRPAEKVGKSFFKMPGMNSVKSTHSFEHFKNHLFKIIPHHPPSYVNERHYGKQ
jgi:hypothetical protein